MESNQQDLTNKSDQVDQQNQNHHSVEDDNIIEQLRNNEINLPESNVRSRQRTCQFKDVDKDQVIQRKYYDIKIIVSFSIKLPSFAKDFQPARRMTLQTIIKKDKGDASLETYKQRLLGNINKEEVSKQEPVEVEIVKIEIVCKDRPQGNITLDFSNLENFAKKEKEKEMFSIKEGSVYFMRVFFKVRFDCVYGLKFVNNVWRHFIKVDKYEETMGCFSPKQEVQVIDLMPEEAPEGILGRGMYKGKIMFLDNDGIVHMQFDYNCKISKKW